MACDERLCKNCNKCIAYHNEHDVCYQCEQLYLRDYPTRLASMPVDPCADLWKSVSQEVEITDSTSAISRLYSSIAHLTPMPPSTLQNSIKAPEPQYPSGLGRSRIQYQAPPIDYRRPSTCYQPQHFYRQAETHHPMINAPSVWAQHQHHQRSQEFPPQAQPAPQWTQPHIYQPLQQYPPQGQPESAWALNAQQENVENCPPNNAQSVPISRFRPIRPKPPTSQISGPQLSGNANQGRGPHVPHSLISTSKPKLNVLLQPLAKRGRPRRPKKVPSRAYPSQTLPLLEPQDMQVTPEAVKLDTATTGIGHSSTVMNAIETVPSRPYTQVSQLSLPVRAVQRDSPVPSALPAALPQSLLPSHLDQVCDHQDLPQPITASNYDHFSPQLQLLVNDPHLMQRLLASPSNPPTASEARSILQVPASATHSEIRAAYWFLEFLLHPHRHRDESPAVQSLAAQRLARAQQAVDMLGGFVGTCWDLERDFNDFGRSL